MKLYFDPMACSMAARIAIYAANVDVEFIQVDVVRKTLQSGGNYREITPAGRVPALHLDDGQILTEGPAVLQFIAAQNPEAGLMPPANDLDHYRTLEWLNFVTSELHKKLLWFSFDRQAPKETRAYIGAIANGVFAEANARLMTRPTSQPYLVASGFTVADAYLVWALNMMQFAKHSFADQPALMRYFEHVSSHPAVKRAIADEMALR